MLGCHCSGMATLLKAAVAWSAPTACRDDGYEVIIVNENRKTKLGKTFLLIKQKKKN